MDKETPGIKWKDLTFEWSLDGFEFFSISQLLPGTISSSPVDRRSNSRRHSAAPIPFFCFSG